MKAVVIGPGRIGAGFAGQALRESGYEVVFLARNPIIARHLDRVRRYRLNLSDGGRPKEVEVAPVRAVCTSECERAANEIATADIVVTAVGAANLRDVAPLIAAGLRQRAAPTNVLAFENMRNASRRLRDVVMERLREQRPAVDHGFAGAVVERVVAKRCGDAGADEPLVFVGETSTGFRVDRAGLVSPLPTIRGMILTDPYEAWVKRKLYTYSAGHVTAAYLGYLKGYHYIHSAIRDREIRAAVLAAMAEGQRGLAAHYGPEISGEKSALLEIISRFDNAALCDRIERVGRDPKRKLSAGERLVGAAHLAEQAGVPPRNLALAAAAALCFMEPDDPSAAELERELETKGPEKTIHRVCGLRPDRGLGKLVSEDSKRLLDGRNGGGLLLSLSAYLWSSWDDGQPGRNGNGTGGRHGAANAAGTNGTEAPSEENQAGSAPTPMTPPARRWAAS